MTGFIGRTEELKKLKSFAEKKTASLLVIRGRRRIGKSRLVEEFAKPYRYYSLSGIAPTKGTTAQGQRDDFAAQLGQQGFPKIKSEDWNDLFWLLADKTQKGRCVVLLDEISWMGSEDPLFLGKLKNAWDLHFKKNPQLILILCGSASSWIEKNILSSTGFLGRISFTMTLEQLSLPECQLFWGKQASKVSAMEKLKILSVTGGIPRYLEEINPNLDAETNIRNLCFTKGGILVDEFERIFNNIFIRESDNYRKIVEGLANGSQEFKKIFEKMGTKNSGRIFEYLEELQLAGFIRKDRLWNFKTGFDSKISQYRLTDNYLRFYLKYIDKQKSKIDSELFDFKSLWDLSHWSTVMGLQFENLVLNNRSFIFNELSIQPGDIVAENPFIQHQTQKQRGCQIDYLIQTRFGSLYVCEIKFSKHPISLKIVEEVEEKIKRFKRPKSFSCRPVLIHVNGVDEEVVHSGYFSKIIDFSNIFVQ